MAMETGIATQEVLERQEPANSTSPLTLAWQYKWLIVLGLTSGIGGGYLYFLRQPVVFESQAEVLVTSRRPPIPVESNMTVAPDKFDMTFAKILKSPEIASRAVEIGNLESFPSMQSDPVAAVIAGLNVSGGGGDNGIVLTFKYRNHDSRVCAPVLRSVTDAYTDFLGRTYQDVSQETAELITTAKDQLMRELASLEKQYATFRETSPLLITSKGTTDVHETRLSTIESKRADAVLRITQINAKMDALEQALKRGSSREALRLVVASLDDKALGGGATKNSDSALFPLLMEEQLLLEKYGEDHPSVVILRKRIELTRRHLLGDDENDSRDVFEIYLESLREEQKIAEEELAQYDNLFKQEQDSSRNLAAFHIENERQQSEISRKNRLFDAVLRRLEEVNLLQNNSGVKIKTIMPPTRAKQVEPELTKCLIWGGLLGLLASSALAYVCNAADRRFRNPEDIQTESGVPVVGHIPVIEVDPNTTEHDERYPDVSPMVRIVYAPKGRVAEAYRAVRTALYFSTRGGGHRIIQVTSPSPGDGKSTLTANLAASIAETGKRILLVDCDFRRPRVHKYFMVDNAQGVSSVILGSAELADAIKQTSISNLDVMPCGPRPDKPAELLTGAGFEGLLETLREKYDVVIVDSPPVLAVTDPVVIAPRVDGVLIVMRLTKTARANMRRSLETLEAVGGRVTGIVVNGLGGGSGQGYGRYGNYTRYGYGRGYYGYNYRYGSRYGYSSGSYGYGYGYGYNEYYGDGEGRQRRSKGAARNDETTAISNGKVPQA